MQMPRLMLAGTQSGVGKTTLTMGILGALSKRMVVQPYKVGPDYIDPAYHTYITKRKSRNLDNYLLENKRVQELFVKNMEGAQLGIIEGVMGLYDGAGEVSDIGSSASVAKALSCPVVLVVDGSGISTSVAAIVKGFIEFDPQVNLKGVILNKVNSQGHYNLLKEAIEAYTGAICYGYLPRNDRGALKSRHLGLIPSCEMVDLDSKIDCLIEDVEKTIDIEGLITLAKSVKSPIDVIIEKEEVQFQDIHIGIAYDEAFNFYYEDNLDLLKALGATLHFFSPIRDKVLPESLHLLYFGGGFPEVFAKELEANQEMKKLLLDKLQDGIPYLAECGGLMYLNHQLLDFQGNNYKMLGWLNGQCVMTKGLKRFGYKTLTFNQDSVLGSKGTQIKVHEFHHSETELMEEPLVYDLKKIRKGKLMTQYECGYMKGNGVAGYPHFHFYSNPIIIKNLLMAAQVYRDK